jgi:phage tail sheath gpL-like
MSIPFNSIPTTTRLPLVAVEFDSSKAQQGPALLAYRALIMGQKLAAGTAVANSLVRVSNLDQAIAYGGRGSMLHRMYLAWTASNKSTELWFGVLADDGAGVAAQGTITITGPATAAGTIALYVGGERLTIGVNVGDTATVIAAAIAAAINAAADLPITAAAAVGVVTWTFRHKGLVGNSYDVRHSFNFGEALPAGVTLVAVATTAGTTNPVLTALIAAMSDLWFQVIAHPYTDATSLTALEVELASRNGPLRSMDGVAITSMTGTSRRTRRWAVAAIRSSRRSRAADVERPAHASDGVRGGETAAILAAAVAADPARPLQTLTYNRAIAGNETDLVGRKRAEPVPLRRHLDDEAHAERRRGDRARDHDVPGRARRTLTTRRTSTRRRSSR